MDQDVAGPSVKPDDIHSSLGEVAALWKAVALVQTSDPHQRGYETSKWCWGEQLQSQERDWNSTHIHISLHRQHCIILYSGPFDQAKAPKKINQSFENHGSRIDIILGLEGSHFVIYQTPRRLLCTCTSRKHPTLEKQQTVVFSEFCPSA